MYGRGSGTGNMRIGRWGERFLAYVIDVIIVGLAVGVLLAGPESEQVLGAEEDALVNWPIVSSVFFAYFVILEYFTGYTIGKRVFRLMVSDKDGARPTIKSLLISNFGKAYLMPFDAIIGMIVIKDTKQRALAKFAGVITVKVSNSGPNYKLD